jgi:dTDP-glucose pyrophosphorylase
MKAIILAAGRGSRMGSLTDDVPKPLIEWRGKSLLAHKLDSLPANVDTVGIAVHYKAEAVVERIGQSHARPDGTTLSIQYIHLDKIVGTGDALYQCHDFAGNDHVMVLMGDDIYSAKDMADLADDIDKQAWSMLFHMGLDDTFTYTGACVIGPGIFSIPPVAIKDGTEFGLPQTIATLAMDHGQHVRIRFTKDWKKMNKPEDLQ